MPVSGMVEKQAAGKGAYARAWRDHRAFFAVSLAYILLVLAQVVYVGIPLVSVTYVLNHFITAFLFSLVFLTGMYIFSFVRFFCVQKHTGFKARYKNAVQDLDRLSAKYLESDLFAYACIVFLVTRGNDFFFIQKSLIPVLHPYALDPFFAEWDRILHFGHYPHEFIVPLVEKLHLTYVLDWVYASWLVVMTLAIGYNLFMDKVTHRRLCFLWSWLLSWIILGSFMAVAMSSVGPVFFHHFYPDLANPYAGLLAHLNAMGDQAFMFSSHTRALLMEWSESASPFTVNKLSAMPSMHVGIAWLLVLYARAMGGRKLLAAAILFFAAILIGSVYLGFHYAVDGYVSILVTSLLWWGTGLAMDRYYPRTEKHSLWSEE